MKNRPTLFPLTLIIGLLALVPCQGSDNFSLKPLPEEALLMLQNGNKRFSAGHCLHPHTTPKRLAMAGTENQARHALATVIACSDSRLPVEMVFDAGVMDIFSIRLIGNLCSDAAIASIEYGLIKVNTPLLVFMGHTQCGAITFATHLATQPEDPTDHSEISNTIPVVKQLTPAVSSIQGRHPHLHPEQIIPLAIEENVWIQMNHFLSRSASSRQLIQAGKVKVVGAVYDVGSGKVHWLPQENVDRLLQSYLPKEPIQPSKKPIFSFLRPKEETAMTEDDSTQSDQTSTPHDTSEKMTTTALDKLMESATPNSAQP